MKTESFSFRTEKKKAVEIVMLCCSVELNQDSLFQVSHMEMLGSVSTDNFEFVTDHEHAQFMSKWLSECTDTVTSNIDLRPSPLKFWAAE